MLNREREFQTPELTIRGKDAHGRSTVKLVKNGRIMTHSVHTACGTAPVEPLPRAYSEYVDAYTAVTVLSRSAPEYESAMQRRDEAAQRMLDVWNTLTVRQQLFVSRMMLEAQPN